MDALFFHKHSKSDDLEIRYALRAIERHMPWVRRVVVFAEGKEGRALFWPVVETRVLPPPLSPLG